MYDIGIGYLFLFLKVFNKIVKISFVGEGKGRGKSMWNSRRKNCSDWYAIHRPSRRIFWNYYSLNKRLDINVAAEK